MRDTAVTTLLTLVNEKTHQSSLTCVMPRGKMINYVTPVEIRILNAEKWNIK